MPNINEIEAFLSQKLSTFSGRDLSEINESEDLVSSNILDSLNVVNLILAIEEEYDVQIYPDEARELITINKIAQFICDKH